MGTHVRHAARGAAVRGWVTAWHATARICVLALRVLAALWLGELDTAQILTWTVGLCWEATEVVFEVAFGVE